MTTAPDSPPEIPRPPTRGRLRTWHLVVGSYLALLAGIVILDPPTRGEDIVLLLIITLMLLALMGGPGWLAGWLLTRLGQKVGWPAKVVRGIAIAGAATVIFAIGFSVYRAFALVRDNSKLKAMLPRQLAAGADQFFLEFNDRIFLPYGELVGPQCYIKSYSQTDGEDPGIQFPIRRGWGELLPVRLPDGSTVERSEVFAAVGQSGLIATYPRPQEAGFDLKRVYRLECGVSYRGYRVVHQPPDPAGREGRDQDGIHTFKFPDGRRFEITYHGGTPDGPFRAFYADGAPWGEATYRQGRVIEAWIISRKGRRFDELHDGPAASAGLTAEAEAEAEQHARRGREKLAAKDFRGAEADFTAALNRYQFHSSSYLGRAQARRALGDHGGAVNDYRLARDYAENGAERTRAESELKDLQQGGQPR